MATSNQLGGLLGFAAGLALGVVATFAFHRDAPPVASEVPASPSIDLERELGAIRSSIEALTRAPRLAAPVEESSRSVPDAAGEVDLVARLDRIEQRLAALPSGGKPLDPAASSGFSFTSVVAGLEARLADALALEDEHFFERRRKLQKEFEARHGLWSLEQVLATYGRPTEIHATPSGLSLVYDTRLPGDGRPVAADFLVCEGLVVRADLELER